MIAEVSVFLPGQAHMSAHLAGFLTHLDKLGIEHQLGTMGTSLRGSADQVFTALKEAAQYFKAISPDVVMNVNIMDMEKEDHTLAQRVDSVLKHRSA